MIKKITKSILLLFLGYNGLLLSNCIPSQLYNHKLGKNVTAVTNANLTEQLILPECKTSNYVCDSEHMATLMQRCCYENQLSYVPYGNSTGFCY